MTPLQVMLIFGVRGGGGVPGGKEETYIQGGLYSQCSQRS